MGILLFLRCGTCGETEERTGWFRVVRGEFVPVTCSSCGARAAAPTVRPYELTHGDKKMLRAMRIAAK